jgi:hypothetical protein
MDKTEEWCFFKEIGEAISRWALIEHELYAIATIVLKPQNRFVLWDAFTAIENFRSKLSFVDRAIHKSIRNATLKAEWEALQRRVATSSTQRNHLVHRICISYPQSQKPGRTISLEPNFRKKEPIRKRPEPPSDAFCVQDIHRISHGFLELFHSLVEFAHKAAGKQQGLPSGLLPQSNRQMTFLALRRRMYEELSLPQKSSVSKRAAKKTWAALPLKSPQPRLPP